MHMPNGSSADSILTVGPERLPGLLWRRLEPDRWPLKPAQLPDGAVLVGGAVRDGLLNRLPPCPDLDLVIPGAVLSTVQRLAKDHGGVCVVLDEQRDMARLVLKGWTIDFARFEGDDLTEDLFRRDFKLNAIALTLSDPQQLIDPTGGIQDLQNGLICAIRESNLRDDPLRLLRALRLMAELEMRIDADTLAMLEANSPLLTHSAPERIQAELLRLVAAPAADEAIALLQALALLNPWRPRDLEHSHSTLGRPLIANSSMTLEEQTLALPLARLTGLLSDPGLKSLRFSRRQIQRCSRLRYWQERIGAGDSVTLDETERLRLHQDLEADLPALVLCWPKQRRDEWMQRWRDPKDPLFHPCSPLDGDTLQKALSLQPGPKLGALIQHLTTAHAYGRVSTREQVLDEARRWLHRPPSTSESNRRCD